MPTTFSIPTDTDWATTLLASMMKKHHEELNELGVKVGIVMCHNEDGPAVKHGGHGAAATIKVMSLKDRLTKGYDAELLIDESLWKEFGRERQAALLDHELEHLRVVKKKDKNTKELFVQFDDIGRPKLRTVIADWFGGDGWASVVHRHGEHAIEFYNAQRAHELATAALNGSE